MFDVLDEPRYPSFDEPSDVRGLAVFVELTRAGLTSTSATLVDGNSGLRCETSTRIDGQVVRVSVGNVIGASRTIACFDHVGGLPTYWFGATAFANRGANLEWIDRTYAPRGGFDGPFATAEVVERTGRVAGADRYATAAGIGAREFPDGTDVVYLARAVEPLVDALAGGMVADGPVLVVPPDGAVPPTVRAEVDRLDLDTVVALGGPAAISEPMLLAVADGRDTLRRSGANRYGTAVAVSQEQFPDGAPVVYLARAVEPLVDAVAGGTLSDGPVLLVPPAGQVPEVVATEIARLDPATVVALGGPSAVGDDVLVAAAAGRERDRVAGDDCYDTAVRIAHRRGTGRTI